MNNKKICFITYVDNNRQYEECLVYINNLNIPYGYEIDAISVKEAESIASAYNYAMKNTDAKYKVYLHQDTFIINKNFIYDMLSVFNSNEKIGMIGVVGSKTIETSGIWWDSSEVYGSVIDNFTGIMQQLELNEVKNNYEDVKLIDGLIMITNQDLTWMQDTFKGLYFYDTAQCIEFIKSGYKIVIPKQSEPWCIHDCGSSKLNNDYHEYTESFLKEYSKDIIEIIKKKIENDEDIYEYEIIQWRNYYTDKLHDRETVNKLDEFLISKYNLGEKQENELFYFDKIKGLEIVNSNREEFNKYLNIAQINLNSKDYEQASRWCYEAAKFASENHPGFYTSNLLENILIKCANNVPKINDNIKIQKSNGTRRRVLHVLSEGFAVGGHTRLLKKWINNDKESEHSLVTTWQMKTTPKELLDEIKARGGWIYSLEDIENFIERAAVLRKLAYEWADVVVLHIHMYDPIPAIAFGVKGGPPILFMNHADHLFWIGNSIIDGLIDYRNAGKKLSIKRRNINRNSILPLPLNFHENSANNKKNLREKVGISDDVVLLLTIASEYKYQSFGKIHYIDIVKKILKDNMNTMLIVIGPNNKGIWAEAYNDTNGRILPLGIKEDVEPYYAIADIYIDSYMIGSNTSALDAGIRGIPVVSLTNPNNLTLSFNDYSYDKGFDNIDSFFNYANRLIADSVYRKEIGNALSEKIKKDHIYEWKKYLSCLYRCMENKTHGIFNYENNYQNIIENCDLFLAVFQKREYSKKRYNYFILNSYFEKYKKENNKFLLRLTGEKLLRGDIKNYNLLYELAKSYRNDDLILSNKYFDEAVKNCPKNSEIINEYIKSNIDSNIEGFIEQNLDYNRNNYEYLCNYLLFERGKQFNELINKKSYNEALEFINKVNNIKANLYKVQTIKKYCDDNNFLYKVIKEKTKRNIFEPYYYGYENSEKVIVELSPEIYVAELNDVDVVGENSVILAGNNCLYDLIKQDEEKRYDIKYSSLIAIDENYAIINADKANKIIDNAISLIGFASNNYYHFTVELLSRLQYADTFEEYRSLPILVDEVIKNIPQYYDLLRNVNKYNHSIIFIEKNKSYRVNKLVYPSYNTWMPLNLKEGIELKSKDSLISESAIKYIRNSVIKDYNKKGFRKIFISRRKSSNSRLINEKSIIQLFEFYGFEVICPEDLTFEEQIRIFSEAEYIAGASGAAFTNIIYCSKNVKILCIIPKEYNFYIYSTISKLLGLECIFLDAEVSRKSRVASAGRFILNLNYCKNMLHYLFGEINNVDDILQSIQNKEKLIYEKYNIDNNKNINNLFTILKNFPLNYFYRRDINKYFSIRNYLISILENIIEIFKIKDKFEKDSLIEILCDDVELNIKKYINECVIN